MSAPVVIVTFPRLETWNLPLPMLMLPPLILPPVILGELSSVPAVILSPVIVPAAIFTAVIAPAAILSAVIAPAAILSAVIVLILAESINTTPPVTVNGDIEPAPVSLTTWNLSA